MPDPKDNMKKQRVTAKACVEAVQRADGNRYTFHNNWWSKEDEANRFSYYCNDSILNKGRSANGGAGTIGMLWSYCHPNHPLLTIMASGQKVQKPVYDCKGIITVKFSAVKQNLQVQYKHVPVHKFYEERAPPPRRRTNRWKLAELHNPERYVTNPPEFPPTEALPERTCAAFDDALLKNAVTRNSFYITDEARPRSNPRSVQQSSPQRP